MGAPSKLGGCFAVRITSPGARWRSEPAPRTIAGPRSLPALRTTSGRGDCPVRAGCLGPCRAPPRGRGACRRVVAARAHAEHFLRAMEPARCALAATAHAAHHLGAVAAIRTQHFRAAWSVALSAHHFGPMTLARCAFATPMPSTTSGRGACTRRAPPRAVAPVRCAVAVRAHAEHRLGAVAPVRCAVTARAGAAYHLGAMELASAAHHLGTIEPVRYAVAARAGAATTSGPWRGACPGRGGGQGLCRGSPRALGA